MTHILAQLRPNNQIIFKAYTLADGYGRKKGDGSTSEDKEQARLSRLLHGCEIREKMRRFGTDDETLLRDYTDKSPSWKIHVCDLERDPFKAVRVYSDELATEQQHALDLLKKSQQSKKVQRSWGKPQTKKVFRKAGGDKILQGGAIIDRFVGVQDSYMLTLTLPGNTWKAMDALARWSGYIVNRCLQVIRRVDTSESPLYWFFVWEHQKRGALHLHLCAGMKNKGRELEKILKAVKDKWFNVLLALSEKENIDMFAGKGFRYTWKNRPDKWQWDLQPIKKSVAGYFAKYCAKNKDATRKRGKKSPPRHPPTYPSRYWGSSASVKKKVKLLTVTYRYSCYDKDALPLTRAGILELLLDELEVVATWSYRFQVEIDNTEIVVSSGTCEGIAFNPSQYKGIWHRFRELICCRPPTNEELDAWMQ